MQMFEHSKLERFNKGRKPSTITRDLASISCVLSRAVKIEKLSSNVIRKVDVPRLDRSADRGKELATRCLLISQFGLDTYSPLARTAVHLRDRQTA